MMMRQMGYLLIFIFLTISCDLNNDAPSSCTKIGDCDKCITTDRDLFNQTNTDNYTIQHAVINQDCLEITFSSSGCSGNSWEIELIDQGSISETAILQRDLKLKLESFELCNAIITRTISFNLTSLQLNYENKINLKIDGYNSLIRYEY
ncbi:hypothetical protein IFO69_18775 [Echinicola sp. CAU 1574]|uniref:Uncharacterized protein n=1 Tax=Echinicola arenosa TaxID=2774144 RepID=A0ABR9ASE6_9BACT|nr:hypothetical protein [Echinicola arenosa]MBD8490803.1 hypothetical protein [Echinicola arenosa]